MYVCIYVYMYMCMYKYIHICMYTYIYMYTYSPFGRIGAPSVMWVPNHPNGAFLKFCKKGGWFAWCLINDFV